MPHVITAFACAYGVCTGPGCRVCRAARWKRHEQGCRVPDLWL
jgi:hypothetical protein